MKLTEVRHNAFAMPLSDTAYPPGPYKFYNRAPQIHEFILRASDGD
jgi:acetoacetate decarboxylase